ncbi:hypothetical protein BC835DRAFT_1415223 [Cytidiella melzeri]|nr:hypothetical protein BC835DRAFT_1415223 [Cytidiella melzeri]
MMMQTTALLLTAAAVVVPFLAFAPQHASAQSSAVTCKSGYSWMSNDEGQSPCLVAAYLIGQCLTVPTTSIVLPLEDNPGFVDYYAPPSALHLAPTNCTCSTVVYSLLAGCGLCQGQGYTSWTLWKENCLVVEVAQFPESIPSVVTVPQWAYIDVTNFANNFSVSAAQQLAEENKPDVGVTSTSTPSGTSPVSAPASSETSISPVSDKKKTSNTGAIVGGVVGGVGGLALILIGVWLWMRHRKNRAANTPVSATTTPFANVDPGSTDTPDGEKPAFNLNTPSPLSSGGQYYQQQQQQQLAQMPALHANRISMRPYNPDDPSTFPDAMMMGYASPSPPPPQGHTPTLSSAHGPSSPVSTAHPGSAEVSNGYAPTQF